MRNVSDKSCRENQNTHFVFNTCYRKSCLLWENVKKNCIAGQTTGDNMAHAHCMLDNQGYRHTLRIRNRFFSTSTMFARTLLSVTMYLYCLPYDVSNSGACFSAIIDSRYSCQQVVTKRSRKWQQWTMWFNMHFSAHPLSRHHILH